MTDTNLDPTETLIADVFNAMSDLLDSNHDLIGTEEGAGVIMMSMAVGEVLMKHYALLETATKDTLDDWEEIKSL